MPPSTRPLAYRAGALWGRLPRWGRVAFLAGVAGLSIAAWRAVPDTPPPAVPAIAPRPQAATTPPPDPRDVRRGQAALAVKLLRNSMHDPAAFELVDAQFMPDDAACYTYRAKNGFGALRQGRAVLTPSTRLLTAEADAKAFTTAWNAHCAGRSGEPITAYVQRFVL